MNHIILFDFPATVVDYLHRAGRTGRVGSPHSCMVTSLVCRKREYALVRVLKASFHEGFLQLLAVVHIVLCTGCCGKERGSASNGNKSDEIDFDET